MNRARRILPYVWYPLCMLGAIAIFEHMRGGPMPLAVAVYLPVLAVGLFVIGLQAWFPERTAWRANAAAIKTDLTFMALVQVALPSALGVACALALADRAETSSASSIWPSAAPLALQIALMLVIVDGMRYWLHRACHRVPFLWRLHAVHHSPPLLYSLNSARFHPLEKLLHFSVDTVPFILLGVGREVLAGYFVLYAANGLLQHSNIRLRYGWLNYIVGSAETHRWHHARDARIAACNFGSSTALWDLLFSTWYLPPGQRVTEVGIMENGYTCQESANDFIAQLCAPFGFRGRAQVARAARNVLANMLVRFRLRITLLVQGLRIAMTVRNPMRAQRALLADILHRNRATAFGSRHGFDAISDYAAFARAVPVREFEALRPYIDAEIERGESALTQAAPRQYVRTSGSTGVPKDIPLVPFHLDALRRIHETAVAYQYRNCPAAFDGSILAIVSPAREGALDCGKPFGSASGIVAGNTPATVAQKFVVPAAVFAIADSRIKYLLILRLALAQRDITYVGTANATTLLALMTLYREHAATLIDDVRHGTFFRRAQVPAEVVAELGDRLCACPERADELAALRAARPDTRMADLWPDVRLVVTWTCGSVGTAVSALRRELSPRTRVLELGYIASEFRATITLGRRAGAGLPTLDTHFFEFIERERWDRGERTTLLLDRVRKGVDYYIVVTTPSGLYRYFINDIVRVTGFLYRTPLLQFMQKGKGVTSLTGEKLYESQVLRAVHAATAECGRAVRFVMMLADEDAGRYQLYVETDAGPRPNAKVLASAVDAKLKLANIEYLAKRESARLGPLDAHWLIEETGDAFKQFCVGNGQREGQYKPSALLYRRSLAFRFDRFVAA